MFEAVSVSEKLIANRDSVKEALGSGFAKEMTEYMEIIESVATGKGTNVLDTAYTLATDLKNAGLETSIPFLMAAAVELIETQAK